MSRQLPSRTKILIVGAGPSGLASAVSLRKHGVSAEDIVVVDRVGPGDSNASRAIVIHSATLESLATIGCADELDSLGIHMEGIQLRDRKAASIFANSFSSLRPYTKYPYALVVSQTYTEMVLLKALDALSLKVFRPYNVVSMKKSDGGNGLDVSFENGEVITAQYVVGADGTRSVIRQLSGIAFSDPKGLDEAASVDPRTAQIVLADLSFTENIDHIFSTDPFSISFGFSSDGFFLTAPLGHPKVHSEIYGASDPVYRIAFPVPLHAGEAPSHPSLEVLQKFVDRQAPVAISSDPSQNPRPVRIKKVYWSTRFRTRSAIADTFFKRIYGASSKEQNGGIVMLVGDAAHIHSPAGGQGMNLAIRDAVGLGSVLAQQVRVPSDLDNSVILEEFARERHNRALEQIEMTKRFMWLMANLMNPFSFSYWVIYFLGMIPFMKRKLVWQLSGLGNR
ncbi:hypothetical protein VKT23_010314 [Stygiomarasmius scandens]|uniref:FAD-binding domain-containing protein n=1 Tax=Marasmiellus scandens TaxID=2682957 RepID=A0ABR1JGH6_9AGAR